MVIIYAFLSPKSVELPQDWFTNKAAISLFYNTNIAATTYVHMLYNPYREATLGM